MGNESPWWNLLILAMGPALAFLFLDKKEEISLLNFIPFLFFS